MRPAQCAALAVVVPLLSLAAVAPPAADGERHTVHQSRPFHVGEVVDLETTYVRHLRSSRTVGGGPPTTRAYDWTVRLDSRCTVRAVDRRGVATAVRYQVQSSEDSVDGRTGPLLPAGYVFDATGKAGGGTAYAGVSAPLPPAYDRVLRGVVTVLPADAPTIDDLFPPGRPRAAGESWPLDPGQWAAMGRAQGWPAAGKPSGRATLKGVEIVAGKPCLRVDYTCADDGITPAPPPAGTATLTERMTTDTTVLLPVDGSLGTGPFDQAATIDVESTGKDADGKPYAETDHYDCRLHKTCRAVLP